ncbi:MAG TPA: cupin domain-containing protein [Planctomycetota bacterium]|jgi:anti-sigma factor ChrR (cupin superfamily)|nr:cupin domain-containing protein [Planctomycetota bacterium]
MTRPFHEHGQLDDDARDRATRLVLGSLPPAEAARMEAHLARCPTCREEVEALSSVVGELDFAAPEAEPPAEVRARVLARVRAERVRAEKERPGSPQPWKDWTSAEGPGGFTVAFAADGSWEATSFSGVETRRLFVDPANDRITMLVRMAPGSRYPSHVHAGPEECYVLQGELRSGSLRMRPGDYKRAAAGSVDPLQSTEEGCLLLITSSSRDELIEGSAR